MTIVDEIDEMYDKGGHEGAERFMLERRAAIMADPNGSLADLIAVCNELGALYREKSRYEESVYNFELALSTTERVLGTSEAEECAVLRLNVAGTYRYMGETEKAIEYYEAAYRIMAALGGKDGTYEMASLLNNLSNAYQDIGMSEKAMEYALPAYEITRDLCAGQTEEAISLMNLASIAARMGDLAKAGDYAKRAMGIYEALGKTGGHYPAAVNIAAVVDFKRGDLEAALAGFERSAELTRASMGVNRDYASALMNVSAVLDAMGRRDEAAAKAAEAEEIRSRLR